MQSEYSRFFDECNERWSNNPNDRLRFIRQIQNSANKLLVEQGYVYLNDIYELLGIPKTKAGQVVGWNINNLNGDGYVRISILSNIRGSMVLDFNVDGVITNKES